MKLKPVAALVLMSILGAHGRGSPMPSSSVPVGTWTISFTNGVVEVCDVFTIDGEHHALVDEPLRRSRGTVEATDGAFVMRFKDDRTERWTLAGNRFVVEHWFGSAGFPSQPPVLGIAERSTAATSGLTTAERDRLEESGPVVVKSFVAALRKRFTDATAGELRSFIDPRYLREHALESGPFPMRRLLANDIYYNSLSDDPRTAVIVTRTGDAAKETFLFRLTVYRGTVYILPLNPPDPSTKSFARWIWRMKS
jgi:hypothetical protein